MKQVNSTKMKNWKNLVFGKVLYLYGDQENLRM